MTITKFSPEIVFEDSDLIVVNKPAGLPTQGSENSHKPSLYRELQHFLNEREKKDVYLALHHRLDAATSGLILFCKNRQLNKEITNLFRDKKITKKYIAVVDILKPDSLQEEWTIENKLIEYKFKNYKRAKSSPKGKIAITHFKLISQDQDKAVIECIPLTGRLHQIRVHLAEIGLPLQGDFHYNKNYKKSPFKLCAYYLNFKHPATHKEMTLELNYS